MPTLEDTARALWKVWAEYRQHTKCAECETFTYCGRTRYSRWLCLGCWDLGAR